jgi:excisionase family DNA binding protein
MARKASNQSANIEPLRVSVPEAARLLSIGRSQVYKRIASGALAAVRDGDRTLVPMAELRRYSATNAP